MRLDHIALVSETPQLARSVLDGVAAAIQVQILRDVSPYWGLMATVDAFNSLDDVPITYYPMIVRDHLAVDAAGIHLDSNFTPFALIEFSNRWTLTASHEALEMLVDPFGNHLRAAPSIKSGQGLVEYLVEVCDPSEAVSFSYQINGVVVSDFYLPTYFDPVPIAHNRYSFTGAITKPCQVLNGGYLSWRDPTTNRWWQQRWFGTQQPTFHDLGPLTGNEAPRRRLDREVFRARSESLTGVAQQTAEHDMLMAAYAHAVDVREASTGRAQRLHHEIDALLKL